MRRLDAKSTHAHVLGGDRRSLIVVTKFVVVLPVPGPRCFYDLHHFHPLLLAQPPRFPIIEITLSSLSATTRLVASLAINKYTHNGLYAASLF